MLKIPQAIHKAIIEHARRDAPIEACGYLAGVFDTANAANVTGAYFPLTNIDASAEHFSFAPLEQFTAFREAGKRGMKLIACYHSHPASPAQPSAEDIKLAYDPNISYVIVSLAETEPVVKSFRIQGGQVEIEEIEVLP